jgi:hypothetical protein
MNSQSQQESEQDTDLLLDNENITIQDITRWHSAEYLQKFGITQVLNVDIKHKVIFDTKRFLAELEALGIPAENTGFSFCG